MSTGHGTEDCSKFACLSYRWGVAPEEIVRTTSANIAEHTRGININTLPKTVVDAVTVCRELSIPYLWVDALCIIQKRTDVAADDAATRDWFDEGSRMDEIYGMSYLTIYAEAATNCKEPFLGPQGRGTNAFQRRVTGARAPNGREAFVREGGMSQYQSAEKSEMSRRGWCYQEALLPSRRLRFHRTEMVWECNCRRVCECGDVLGLDMLDHLRGLDGKTRPVFKGGRLAEIKSQGSLPFDHAQEWLDIVTDYSKRTLFEPESNKLMAISGIAKILLGSGRGGNDEYLAGLWRSNLLDSLSWLAVGSNAYRRLDGGAPTWSWASLDGSVVFRPEGAIASDLYGHTVTTKHYATEVVDAVVALVSSDASTGNVTGGRLQLRGPLLAVQVATISDETAALWYQERGRMEMPERFPVTLARTRRLASSAVTLDTDKTEGVVDLSHSANDACWISDECSCLSASPCFDDAGAFFALCLYRTGGTGGQAAFLLLKKRRTGEYERVGVGFSGSFMAERHFRPGLQSKETAIFQGEEEKTAVTIV